MCERNLKCLVASLAVVMVAATLASPQPQSVNGQSFRFDAAKLKDRTLWTQVNEQPYRISSFIDSLCLVTRQHYESVRAQNPHASTSITVYVNQIGRAAMFSTQPTKTKFPVGSVIVKEKQRSLEEMSMRGMLQPAEEPATAEEKRTEDADRLGPYFYTLMIKREPGYNPAAGDWEFAVAPGKDAQIEARGKLENCQAYHIEKRDQDFVFRSYLGSK